MNKKIWSWLEGMEPTPTPHQPTPPIPEGPLPPSPPTDPSQPGAPLPEVPPPPSPPPGPTTPVTPPPIQPQPGVISPVPGEPGEEALELLDFEKFREEYIDETSTGKPEDLLEKLSQLRSVADLGPRGKRFFNDNILILLLMREQEIYEASRRLRKVRSPLDMMAQLSETIDRGQLLREIPIKLSSFFGMKGDLYRKFVAALCGGVQIGNGSLVEDVVVSPTRGQRFLLSTRIYTDFGAIELIPWSLSSGDPNLYLREIERSRLQTGSPEERLVLLKRTILSSITRLVKSRVFMICVCNPSSGGRTDIAIQLDNFLLQGYQKGIISLDLAPNGDKQGILKTGELVSPAKVQFVYHPTGEGAKPAVLIEDSDGILTLISPREVIEDAIGAVGNGMVHKAPFEGPDEELDKIQRCIPTLQEMLLKRC